MKKIIPIIAFAFFASTNYTGAQELLSEIRDIIPEKIRMEGFKLSRRQDVHIKGIGFRGRRFTNSWILDSQSREIVWEMDHADFRRRGRALEEFEDRVEVSKGSYEVYYAAFPYIRHKKGWGDFFGRFFDEIFDDEDRDEYYHDFKDELRSFYIEIRGEGRRYREHEIREFHDKFNNRAFISMTALRDDEYRQQGFELTKPMDIQIYAVGEANKSGTYDYGWIVNTETRDKVWKMTYRDSYHAGGARKNRKVNEVILLPKAKYVAFFVTDDSHSFRRWNMAPPYDPMFWGLTLRVRKASDMRNIKLFDYERIPEENVIVDFSRLRDDEFRSQGFTLKRPMKLRIYAIGEGKRHEMYDYGWIVDAKTHRKVWEMDYHNSEHAGGGDKNRLFDGVVEFDKGSYLAYFVTDGSHSYWDWNTAPPYNKEGWGMKIIGAGKNFDRDDVAEYEARKDGSILAQLVRIRDHERERERFTLEKDSDVRIYAIGEGSSGRMYDYAWIEDVDSRRVIWEMTYRKTRHAGGADKNRMVDDVILLRRGEYIVHYESDDSHSYDDWNAAPPYDPTNWGVTIYLVEDE